LGEDIRFWAAHLLLATVRKARCPTIGLRAPKRTWPDSTPSGRSPTAIHHGQRGYKAKRRLAGLQNPTMLKDTNERAVWCRRAQCGSQNGVKPARALPGGSL